jgi:hypothetical protein
LLRRPRGIELCIAGATAPEIREPCALERGAEITTVRGNLRHVSISTTSTYLLGDYTDQARRGEAGFSASQVWATSACFSPVCGLQRLLSFAQDHQWTAAGQDRTFSLILLVGKLFQ